MSKLLVIVFAVVFCRVRGVLTHATVSLDSCFLEPTWDSAIFAKCKEATAWTPRWESWSDLFLDEEHRPRGLILEEDGPDLTKEVSVCLQDGRFSLETLQEMGLLADPYKTDDGEEEDFDALESWGLENLRVASHHVNSSGTVVMMVVENALPPHFASAVEVLAACTRKYLRENSFEHRSFDYGGNDCTFLANLLQLFLPGVAARIQSVGEFAAKWAGWESELNILPVQECGLRTTEHLVYGTFSDSAALAAHEDGGSLYTILFAMVDPDEYGGGEYYVLDEDDKKKKHFRFKPEKYSAVVFLSETLHGVEPVEWGNRQMFTNEFWDLADTPFPHARPDRYDAGFEYFLKHGRRPNFFELQAFCLELERDLDDCLRNDEEDENDEDEEDDDEEDDEDDDEEDL